MAYLLKHLASAAAAGMLLVASGCNDDDTETITEVVDDAVTVNGGAVTIDDGIVTYQSATVTLGEDGRTQVAPYLLGVPGNGGYNLMPLLTVGDEVPLLEGDYPYQPSQTDVFALTGKPDGMGIYKEGDDYLVWVQHEMGTSDDTDFSTEATGQITGARLSVFKFTADWICLGGRNLIEDATSKVFGDSFTFGYDAGTNAVTQGGTRTGGFGRFCSGYLAETGFVDADGNDVPVWFAAEEDETLDFGGSTGSFGWACFPDGSATAVEGLGAFSKEQVYPASQYRATTSTQTVLFGTEDSRDGEVYMWVGEQTTEDPNGFMKGSLYVMELNDGAHINDANSLSVGDTVTLNWTLVDTIDLQDPDLDGIYTDEDPTVDGNTTTTTSYTVLGTNYGSASGTLTGSQAAQAALDVFADAEGTNRSISALLYGPNSTNFDRPEDFHEDPNTPGTFYFCATEGETGGVEGDALTSSKQSVSVVYKFALNAADPAAATTLTVVLEGGGDNGTTIDGSGTGRGVSYDNMVVDTNGNIVLQEDRSGDLHTNILFGEYRYSQILSYDEGSDSMTALFETDILSFDPAEAAGDPGDWETSGIVEVVEENAFGLSAYLLNVQAHSLKQEEVPNVLNGEHDEGGQILVCIPNGEDVPTAISMDYLNRMNMPPTVGHVTGEVDVGFEWRSSMAKANR